MPTHRVLYLLGPENVELRLEPIPQPAAGQILLRLEAATTCGTDLKVYRRGGHPTMLSAPCPFGHEMTGTLAAVGSGVTGWREGDAVVVANSASCGQCRFCRAG
ncbi:MAG: alcohol dehydrogenase catalytic domain-containing protein, partial [Acidobacteriota bacterium]